VKVFETLLRRELAAYFLSPVAYVVAVCFLVLMGLSFWMLLEVLSQGPASVGVMRMLMGESVFFWLALLVVVPAVTMRLFAEEWRSGTWESLMTAPVSEAMVVAAKYLAAWLFFGLLWLPTWSYPFLLARVAPQTGPVDWGVLLATYAGVLCLGGFYIAVGLLASSLTRNQSVAAMITLVALTLLILTGFIPDYARTPGVQAVGRYTSALVHMKDFSRGVLDTRVFVFYATLTAWVLFATVKSLEARRWKS
jgi:ABC-2 type transport system permease protein